MSEEHSEQVNWVARRAECLLPNMFRRLRDIVLRDIQEARRFSPLVAQGFEFLFNADDGRGQFTASRVPPSNSVYPAFALIFNLHDDAIRVDCDKHPDYPNGFFYIRSTWQRQESRCRLTIDEKPYELWQISQLALERLVFQLHYMDGRRKDHE